MPATFADHENAVEAAAPQTLPDLDSEEYRLLYVPTMVAVYTAHHQRMPQSEEALHRHVFGFDGHTGCAACHEETEFLVAHQKKFF